VLVTACWTCWAPVCRGDGAVISNDDVAVAPPDDTFTVTLLGLSSCLMVNEVLYSPDWFVLTDVE
jgi:hypothetical protein